MVKTVELVLMQCYLLKKNMMKCKLLKMIIIKTPCYTAAFVENIKKKVPLKNTWLMKLIGLFVVVVVANADENVYGKLKSR